MRTFISIGSNLGDRMAYLTDAVDSLPNVVAVSNVYETAPVGGVVQDDFLNLVVELDCDLAPMELLRLCHRIESSANRTRDVRWGPRTVDLDIIWMDGVEMNDEALTIPHPRWRERRFVLAPLAELAPEMVSEDDLSRTDGQVRVYGTVR